MKAVVCTDYGSAEVLKLREVEKPIPKKNEVLIKVHATTCHIGDVRIRSFNVPTMQKIPFRLFLGIRRPKRNILGMELSGVVESIGTDIKRFKVGDEVMASAGFVFGAYAEYICLPEDAKSVMKGLIVKKPNNMSFEEAAAGTATGGITALSVLKKANIQPGQKVLIYGASGSVGTFALQLAKYYGAHVTGVCSTKNLDMVKSLGANEVIDYTKNDFVLEPNTYDLFFDAVDKIPAKLAKKSLKKSGKYLNVIKNTGASIKTDDLQFLKELIDEGKLKTYIDRCYPLEEIVEAHMYVEKGHKKGHVVINIM